MTLIDLSNRIGYFSSVSAAGAAGKEWTKISKNAPKPMIRPGDKEKEKSERSVRKVSPKEAGVAVSRMIQEKIRNEVVQNLGR